MTTYRDEFQRQLGGYLRELVPLAEAAVQALDKPGTRALRRKLDAQLHMVVHVYGTMLRSEVDESEWDALRPTLPRYRRVTEVWPARKAVKAHMAARKTAAAAPHLAAVPSAEAPPGYRLAAGPIPCAILDDRPRPAGRPQLVVHDGGLLGRRKPAGPSHQGDAA